MFERAPRVVLANQPTRGLDVGATAEVHRRLLEARERGVAIVLISEDLDELLALSDRVAVIARGRLSQPLAVESVTREQLGLMMAGHGGGRMIRFEPRARAPLALRLGTQVGAVAAALALAAIPLAVAGAPLLTRLRPDGAGRGGSIFALTETLTRATPLIFTGLAAAVAFRAQALQYRRRGPALCRRARGGRGRHRRDRGAALRAGSAGAARRQRLPARC